MPQQDLKLALIQTQLHWENREANLKMFEKHLSNLSQVDLILLPEMFTTGFSMQPQKLADEPGGETLQWLQNQAAKHQAAISGSAIISESGKFYNRLYFVFPEGNYHTYDKRHLFTLAGEEKVYSPGHDRLLVKYKGWKINPQVCYDLRFPVWCRNDVQFDLQFFVANWPARRSSAWKALLKARSIENVCYVAGLNRVGEDGNEVYHSGDSAVYDALGEKISRTEAGAESTEIVTLSHLELEKTRKRFAFLLDRDKFELKD